MDLVREGLRAPKLAVFGDRRARVMAVIGVGLVLTFCVLRETVVPDVRVGTQFVESPAVMPHLLRPIITLVSILTQLLALTLLSRVLERGGRRQWGAIATALATCALGMGIHTAFSLLQCEVSGGGAGRLARVLVAGPLGGMEIYGLWIVAFRYPQLFDEARLRLLETDRLRQAAEISHLREHLQPHFLRNTLNAIAALVTEDPMEARNLLAALGDLLTESIEDSTPFRTLGDEIAWLRRYGEILEARYRGSLRFSWDEGPMTEGALVPRLLLQPLVENAVHHGALARDGDGRVTVRTRARKGGGTLVEVEDNGPGFVPGIGAREGLGLRLVRRRVEMESCGSFRIEPTALGTRAIVELP